MPRGPATAQSFVCRLCDRTFSRAEHRDRHLATHDNNISRPFRCNFCNQQFQRTDTLRRHVDKYCTRNQQRANDSDDSRSRVRSACDWCHSKKLKCDGKRPCHKCMAKQQDCTYQRSDRRLLPPSPESFATVEQQNPTSVDPNHPLAGSSKMVVDEPPSEVPDMQLNTDPVSSSLPDMMLRSWVGGIDMSQEIPPLMDTEEGIEMSYPDATTIDGPGLGFGFIDPLAEMDFTFLPGLSDELFALDSHMLAVPPNSYDDEAHLAYIAELLDLDENGSRLDEQTTRWLQMPLIPRKYDTDMLNALLRVFLRHVSGTFLSFQDFSITSSTLPEQILSMASVGSLFVDFKGSSRVARMLFTDCNRMLNNFLVDVTKFPHSSATSLVQSFIACELFGICGGHPRSRELSEAYHHTMVQVLFVHGLLSDDGLEGDEKLRRERLLSDLFLLEGYRTSLFQLKPILTPAALSHTSLGVGNPTNVTLEQPLNYAQQQVACLINLDPSKPTPCPTMGNLALLSISSWIASGQWVGSSYEAGNRAWEPSIIHTSIDAMLHHSRLQDQTPTLFFGHMIIVGLYAPLSDISEAVGAIIVQRDPTTATIQSIRSWCRSFDMSIALDHALRILDVATQRIAPMERPTIGGTVSYIEAPHDALCIFNAALVIWASKCAKFSRTVLVASSSATHLAQAITALKRMQIAIVRTLCQVLQAVIKVEGSNPAAGVVNP